MEFNLLCQGDMQLFPLLEKNNFLKIDINMPDVYFILGAKTGWIGGKVTALLQEQGKKYVLIRLMYLPLFVFF